ncbi:DsbA family protein [Seleniivibrio woodruffii]|uniref:Thioredoxin-like protein n=1 Tax=Seleniivibrio woodruffii TaxID=1078050 RepID=A0A4R1K891_9BACT|nr:thioredoxin domain-containing protein [Seleniivibrio woodruffii]TCK60522.1 thioredoxin-like protein [Seleniivibrio woodruffii]TVZ36150.1 thioredoxin-like protein [Seleniivibrio woodruffii]
MKRITAVLTVLLLALSLNAFAADIKNDLESNMKNFFRSQKLTNLVPTVTVVKKLNEPAGLYFIKISITDTKNKRSQEQYMFTDGKYIIPEIVSSANNVSIKDSLVYEATPKTNIDLSKATLFDGKKGAKNTIVVVSDFQCPYCRKAHEILKGMLAQSKTDAAVYMISLPLAIHPKAVVYAKVFEAGLAVGKDFSDDLYATDQATDSKTDAQIIDMFAAKSGNPAKFKSVANSKEVAAKIDAQAKYAASLGITGTPHIFFNGKGVGGFNPDMYGMAIKDMK